ncbi:uncharacterized protein EAF02_000603 [Botrytis sinoallii]|uniref:uncharacterized protein n=1 Tax=Botrytis sinoallii TaxID=1463999 RepID=UPI00190113F9|nr:uncharacterized protein EAF02_000603 [Botrytis sinoallii]KAF7893065.1 hypothetical protein EAF02_000603 [Botrytis sinoallii]
MASSLTVSLVAAFQASMAVLLVIFYGALSVYMKLLDSKSAKMMSKISVKFFLPALEFVKIGRELHAGGGHRYNVILVWACLTHTISFLIGAGAHFIFGMPDWITATIMFNNTTSYPLMLIQALDQTGLLNPLLLEDGGTGYNPVEQAKSYFLVYSVLSSCLTFAIGPRMMDTEFAIDPPDEEDLLSALAQVQQDREGESEDDNERLHFPTEHTNLLSPPHRPAISSRSTSFFPSRRASATMTPPTRDTNRAIAYERRPSSIISRRRWFELSDRVRWWLLFFYDFLNAPLLGAIAGAIVGLSPVLHRAFFNETVDGEFSQHGSLHLLKILEFYLSLCPSEKGKGKEPTSTPWFTTFYVLAVRFAIWPVISTGIIYYLAKNTTWVGEDPMLWFSMMFMPLGPPAVKLITMVEVSDAKEEDQHKVAKLLAISYAISPVMCFAVVGSLNACQAAKI